MSNGAAPPGVTVIWSSWVSDHTMRKGGAKDTQNRTLPEVGQAESYSHE